MLRVPRLGIYIHQESVGDSPWGPLEEIYPKTGQLSLAAVPHLWKVFESLYMNFSDGLLQ
jgi:hypothetical protein